MRLKCEIKLNGILFFYKKKDANGEYVLRKDLTQEIKKALGPYKTNPELIQQLDQNIEEFAKIIEEDTRVADDENEPPEVRDRGVIAKILADGASAAANGIKTVGKKVGDGLKELSKKIGSILPGLVGAIASFVFRAAGQAISFLAKNAWLLILAVAAFMIQKLTEKK